MPPLNPTRWFRYRLRTLLALVTLAAVGLGAFKAYVEPFRIQRRAAARLAPLGAKIGYEPGGPAWLRALFGERHFLNGVTVHLEGRRFKSDDLAPLADLPHLERLYLANTPVTDEGLRHIASLCRLKRMSLWQTRITDAGIVHLAGLTDLEVLDIHDTRLTEAALQHFREHPNLVRLIHAIPVGDAGIEALASMPQLRIGSLTCKEVSDDGLRQIAQRWPLGSLSVSSHRVTDAGLSHLCRLDHLRSLEVRDCAATDAGIAQLAALTTLTTLRIANVPIRGECLPALTQNPKLVGIELSNTQISFGQIARHFGDSATRLRITAKGMQQDGARTIRLNGPIDPKDLQHLRHYPHLQSLVLDGSPLDIARVGRLEPMAALRSLELNLTVDDAGAELLGRLTQLRQLSLSGRQTISPQGYRHLARLTGLVELRMRSCGLTDEHLAFLAHMTGLEVLEIPGNRITSAGIDHLQNLSRLRRLNVSSCPEIDDTALAKISALERLENLSAQHTRVTDAGLAHLFDMRCLRNVTVLGSAATKRGLQALRGALLVKGGAIY
jgi:Leucine-rich repeat (LRR) protein